MAKSRVIDRKRQRAPMENDELEDFSDMLDDEGATTEPKPKRKAAPRKKAASKKSEAVTAKEVRLKAYWGVYTQGLQRVGQFEYADRQKADALAAELTESRKSPHFVRLEKQVIDG